MGFSVSTLQPKNTARRPALHMAHLANMLRWVWYHSINLSDSHFITLQLPLIRIAFFRKLSEELILLTLIMFFLVANVLDYSLGGNACYSTRHFPVVLTGNGFDDRSDLRGFYLCHIVYPTITTIAVTLHPVGDLPMRTDHDA